MNSEVRQYRMPDDEENKSEERTVPVTTQESLDAICEKAMRIACLDEMGARVVLISIFRYSTL